MNIINKNVRFHDFLSKERIIWKLNLSMVPSLRGQYERLIELTKQYLYKSIGKLLLTRSDLEEVLLDVEVNLKNRPLTYTEENIEHSALTPNSMTLERDVKLPVMLQKSKKSMKMSRYQMVLQKRKKSMINGRCDRYMYINAREQLGKDSFMNTWQLSERDLILVIKKI